MIDELGLADHGLRYLDVEPAQHNMTWDSRRPGSWSHHHDVDATVESLAAVLPDQADGYRRYAKAAIPAIRMVLDAACEPPSVRGLTRVALRRRLAGAPTLLRWSRRSTADVLRSYFDHDAVLGPAALNGPMVWGISPETPGTGLGALAPAMRHVGHVGRPDRWQRRGAAHAPRRRSRRPAATLRTKSPVDSILCEGERVRGVGLVDGTAAVGADRRVGVQSARHVPALAQAPAARRPPTCSGAGGRCRTPRATSPSSTSCSIEHPRCAAPTARSAQTTADRPRDWPTSTEASS